MEVLFKTLEHNISIIINTDPSCNYINTQLSFLKLKKFIFPQFSSDQINIITFIHAGTTLNDESIILKSGVLIILHLPSLILNPSRSCEVMSKFKYLHTKIQNPIFCDKNEGRI